MGVKISWAKGWQMLKIENILPKKKKKIKKKEIKILYSNSD